ncbi:MAG: TetR/AcrR family transcriptional regulator [Microbacterium sp.]|uniref:SACE_7040 family transcriptional regulator n=1 Tax=Microbacterium sp. TaxID=51671 RepID=UPI0039E705B1
MATGPTVRERAKASRQAALLREAARLFAAHGFNGVSLEDLGTAVGVSGPAIYRHFANKQAVLGAVLLGVSRSLRDGGLAVVGEDGSPEDVLDRLIAFHVDFALEGADVIRVHDRDLQNLGDDDRHTVRRLQREYVELWVAVLAQLHPGVPDNELRVRAHAAFGLINSTPHSVRGLRPMPKDADVRGILASMARASLRA